MPYNVEYFTGLVSYIKEKLIQPALQDYFADFAYMGSAYEFTSVPGSSDFDIQVFLKVPSHQLQP